MKNIITGLGNSFWAFGWMTPAVLPVIELVGRGVFNTLAGIYIVWGLLALFPGKLPGNKTLKILLVVTLVCFSFGLFNAHDLLRALKALLRYGFLSLTLFFTLAALQKNKHNLEKLCLTLSIVGLVLPVVLVLKTVVLTGGEFFVPRHQLLERNMPFLFPFICWFFLQRQRLLYAIPLLSIVGMSYLLVIFYSAGRSALLGFCVAVLIFFCLELGKKAIFLVPVLVAVIAGGVFLASGSNETSFLRNADYGSSRIEKFNQLTSGRLDLWMNAVNNPPSNPLVGVGMGNTRYAENVVNISTLKVENGESVTYTHKVRHLHNFLLDCWYETGFIGVFSLITFFSYILFIMIKKVIHGLGRKQIVEATFLSATLAIFAAGLLSFSYTSNQFTLYLFMLLAVLYHLGSSEIEIIDN